MRFSCSALRRASSPAARRASALLGLCLMSACSSGTPSEPAPVTPPPPPPPPPPAPVAFTVPAIAREFRGMWIATVANIDWPSRSGLPAAEQQAEMGLLLDAAQQTGLNAVVLQVRAAGDALYPSTLEPWSRSLTGTQGTSPGYDPLAFAIAQARLRGLEVHAWFNPFRAGNLSDTARLAPQHFAMRRPDLVRRHCAQLWFDPGEDAVHDQAIAVIRDVVQRYDVDAVHIDDFFYPYPGTACQGDFPDAAVYARYTAGGGTLSRADWRRENVNRFVERMYRESHAVRPSVRVGISPFGIWRPGNPPGITGLDAFASIYADSRLWLQRGWVDYFAPQLYWSIASTGQSFPALIGWWAQQNTQRRHLWPGLASYRIADGSTSPFSAAEIPSQIAIAREQAPNPGGATGTILYNGSSVRTNRGGFASTLAGGLFASGAIPPATTWLDNAPPADPTVTVTRTATVAQLTLATAPADAWWWLVRWRTGGSWRQRLVPITQRTIEVPNVSLEGIVVNAIDRVGNASGDVVWRP